MAHAPRSNSRHAIGFGLVVLLHIGIIWALKNGLASSLVDVLKGPMETKLIEEIKPEKETPPPPPPKFQPPPPPVVIPVDISVAAPPSDNSTAISEQNKKRAPAVEAARVIVPPRSNPRHPVSQPEYPPTSKRLGETGTVVMLLTVDEHGKVIDAKVDKSSGYDRLDQAAIQEALRNWRLMPGTVNGKPATMQYKFAVTFRITD